MGVLQRSKLSSIWTIAKPSIQPREVNKGSCQPGEQETLNDHSIINHFDKLPIEINQRIAFYIDDDRDVYRFRSSCRPAAHAIVADNLSFWRKRFKATFEPASWIKTATNQRIRDVYQQRRKALRTMKGHYFSLGSAPREQGALEVMRDMFVEAFSVQHNNNKGCRPASLNLIQLRNTLSLTNLVSLIGQTFDPKTERQRIGNGLPTKPTTLLLIMQTLFAPDVLSLQPHLYPSIGGLATTQQCVFGTAADFPLFRHHAKTEVEVDMESVTRHLHFWKFHMTDPDEALHVAFSNLKPHERPRYSPSPLRHGGSRPGRHWRGCYGYLDRPDLWDVRDGQGHDERIQDIFEHEYETDAFQSFLLTVHDDKDEHRPDSSDEEHKGAEPFWPDVFEKLLPTNPIPLLRRGPRTRRQFRRQQDFAEAVASPSVGFSVRSDRDAEPFRASGWFHAVGAQSDVPGWRRFVMMKFARDPYGNVDEAELWAYEGVVLPGDQIIVGRWWSPTSALGEDMYSGPFIWWCVDPVDGHE